MRKATLVFIALVIAASACGGGTKTGASGDKGAGGGYCQLAKDLEKRFSPDQSSFDPTKPETFAKFFEEANKAMDAAVRLAPAEIKADIELVASVIKKTFEAFRGVDFTKPEAVGEVFGKVGELSSPEFTAATDRLTKYGEDKCGIAPQASSS